MNTLKRRKGKEKVETKDEDLQDDEFENLRLKMEQFKGSIKDAKSELDSYRSNIKSLSNPLSNIADSLVFLYDWGELGTTEMSQRVEVSALTSTGHIQTVIAEMKDITEYLEKKNKYMHALREQVKKRDDLLKTFDSKKAAWEEMKRKGKADMSKVMAAEEKMRRAQGEYDNVHGIVKKALLDFLSTAHADFAARYADFARSQIAFYRGIKNATQVPFIEQYPDTVPVLTPKEIIEKRQKARVQREENAQKDAKKDMRAAMKQKEQERKEKEQADRLAAYGAVGAGGAAAAASASSGSSKASSRKSLASSKTPSTAAAAADEEAGEEAAAAEAAGFNFNSKAKAAAATTTAAAATAAAATKGAASSTAAKARAAKEKAKQKAAAARQPASAAAADDDDDEDDPFGAKPTSMATPPPDDGEWASFDEQQQEQQQQQQSQLSDFNPFGAGPQPPALTAPPAFKPVTQFETVDDDDDEESSAVSASSELSADGGDGFATLGNDDGDDGDEYPQLRALGRAELFQHAVARMSGGLSQLESGDFASALASVGESLAALVMHDAAANKKQIKLCVAYSLALRVLLRCAELDAVKAADGADAVVDGGHGALALAAMYGKFLADIPLQAKHRIVCVRVGIKRNAEAENFGIAATLIDKLLKLAPPDAVKLEEQRAYCATRQLSNARAISYRLLSFNSLLPIAGSPARCGTCDAIYAPDEVARQCDYCKKHV